MKRINVPKIKFTQEEDDRLIEVIERLGTRDWEGIAQEMKHRTPRQCRERWNNYLSPSITSDPWTSQEDELLDSLYDELGSKWSKIAEYFPNRSANGIRNRYKLRQRRILKEKQKFLIQNTHILQKIALNPPETSPPMVDSIVASQPSINQPRVDFNKSSIPDEFYSLFTDNANLEESMFGITFPV